MAAVFELLLLAAAAIAALALGQRSGKKRNARGAVIRCPGCGSPVTLRDGRWECPFCGDSGIAVRRCPGQK